MWRSSRLAIKLTILAWGWLASPGRDYPLIGCQLPCILCKIGQALTSSTCNQSYFFKCQVEAHLTRLRYFSVQLFSREASVKWPQQVNISEWEGQTSDPGTWLVVGERTHKGRRWLDKTNRPTQNSYSMTDKVEYMHDMNYYVSRDVVLSSIKSLNQILWRVMSVFFILGKKSKLMPEI